MKEKAKRERRSQDRPIKRLRQLEARLDLLLHESHRLRNSTAVDSASWPAWDDLRGMSARHDR